MTCRYRSPRRGVAVAAFLAALPAVAGAAELPAIRTSETNRVAECATPGRLMAYLHDRNPQLPSKFEEVATDYMRHGDALGVRWDYAFFQMLLETGYLTYKGDVKPDQNNFAGLGATGGGVRGESFKDVSTGARAHIEHLLMYSGEHVDAPVAERTRNVQEWGVLTDWQARAERPITFTALAKQWAPTSKRYASDIGAIADRFFNGICLQPDPNPELVAAAGQDTAPRKSTRKTAPAQEKVALAEADIDQAPIANDASRSSVAAGNEQPVRLPMSSAAAVAAAATEPAKVQVASTSPPVTLLNPSSNTSPAPETTQGAAEAPQAPTADVPAKAQAEAPKAKADAAKKSDGAKAKAETSAAAPSKSTGDAGKASSSAAASSAAAKGGNKNIEVAALPGALKDAGAKAAKSPPPAAPKCRVWTASYGGNKAIIIKAVTDKTVNYTVLDVNEGTEKREADAYINAYAKGGQPVGEFQSQPQALEKAFELCPEG